MKGFFDRTDVVVDAMTLASVAVAQMSWLMPKVDRYYFLFFLLNISKTHYKAFL